MLNTLNFLCNNYLNDICIYDYDNKLMHTNNKELKQLIAVFFNNYNINAFQYIFTIDYSNNQINIDLYDLYDNNKILYNINIDLFNNKDAFNTIKDIILNSNNDYNHLNYYFNYSIISINKTALIIE